VHFQEGPFHAEEAEKSLKNPGFPLLPLPSLLADPVSMIELDNQLKEPV
jgi:hypothetical protein